MEQHFWERENMGITCDSHGRSHTQSIEWDKWSILEAMIQDFEKRWTDGSDIKQYICHSVGNTIHE